MNSVCSQSKWVILNTVYWLTSKNYLFRFIFRTRRKICCHICNHYELQLPWSSTSSHVTRLSHKPKLEPIYSPDSVIHLSSGTQSLWCINPYRFWAFCMWIRVMWGQVMVVWTESCEVEWCWWLESYEVDSSHVRASHMRLSRVIWGQFKSCEGESCSRLKLYEVNLSHLRVSHVWLSRIIWGHVKSWEIELCVVESSDVRLRLGIWAQIESYEVESSIVRLSQVMKDSREVECIWFKCSLMKINLVLNSSWM